MNSQGLASWERVGGSPGPARVQAKDWPLCGPASPGIREREGPGHRPHSRLLLEQPRRHPKGHVHGMDGRCYRTCSFTPLAGGLH